MARRTRLMRVKSESLTRFREIYSDSKHDSDKFDKMIDDIIEIQKVKRVIDTSGRILYGKTWNKWYKK